jgi:hypothetical protein
MKDYLIIFLALIAVSCGRNYRSDNCVCNYSVSIAGNMGINEGEVFAAVSSVLKRSQSNQYVIEIIIFSYSSGKEVFSYLEDNPDNIKIKTYSGNINALVKIKQEKSLQKVFFLRAEGNGEEEIILGLAKEIQRTVCNNLN